MAYDAREEILGYDRAQKLARKACENFVASARPGQDEKALTRLAKRLILDCGASASWHSPVVKCGRHTASPSSTLFRAILKKEDVVIVDVGPVVDQFAGDYGITFALGDQPPAREMIASCRHVLDEAGRRICSGAIHSPREIHDILDELVRASGFRSAMKRDEMIHPMPGRGRTSRARVAADFAAHSIRGRFHRADEAGLKGPWCIEVMLTGGRFGAFFEDTFYFTGDRVLRLGDDFQEEALG